MADSTNLALQPRGELGTNRCRRLRKEGLVPGTVYGHGLHPVAVTTSSEALSRLVAAGSPVIEMQIDGGTEKALLRDVQWDTYGMHVLHFDLQRVSADERVTVDVPIELRGIAPGTQAGGILDHHLHALTIDCFAHAIPDAIRVKIGTLEVGHAVHVSDLELPEGIHVHNPPEAVVVQVVLPRGAEELEAEPAEGPAEPELIGRKPEESAAEES